MRYKFFVFIIGVVLFSSFASATLLNQAKIYYSMDSGNVTGTRLLDISGNGYHAFQNGTGSFNNLSWGKIGLAYNVSAAAQASSRLEYPQTSVPIHSANGYTISMWLYAFGNISYNYFPLLSYRADEIIYIEGLNTGRKLSWKHWNGATYTTFGVYNNYYKNTWYHIVATWNDTSNFGNFYVNGQIVGNATSELAGDSDAHRAFFGYNGGSYSWYGIIDEVAIYDTYLNPESVAGLYNNSAGCNPYANSNGCIQITAPPTSDPIGFMNISIQSPTNNNFNTSNYINFSYRPTSTNSTVLGCSLYTNSTSSGWVLNLTTNSTTNNTLNKFSDVFFLSGKYIWNVECYDINSHVNMSLSNFSLEINALPQSNSTPIGFMNVSIQNPQNNQIHRGNYMNFSFIPASSNSSILGCSLYVNSTGAWALNSTTNITTNNVNNSMLNVFFNGGKYIWNFECYDIFSHVNMSFVNKTFTIDTLPKGLINVTLDMPKNNVVNDSHIINFSYTPVDTNSTLTSCSLWLNSTSAGLIVNDTDNTITNNTKNYFYNLVLDGNSKYQYKIECNNSFQANVSPTYTFNTFDYKPFGFMNVTLINPPDNTQYGLTTEWVNLSYIPVNTNSTILNCSLYLNLTGSMVLNQSNSSIINNSVNTFFGNYFEQNKNYTWNVECYGNTSNTSKTASAFEINKYIPYIRLLSLSPADNLVNNSIFVNFTYNITDGGFNFTSCFLVSNYSGFWISNYSGSLANGSQNIINVNWSSSGIYKWGVGCNASNGTAYYTENSTLRTDPYNPVVSWISPEKDVYTQQGLLYIAFNVTDPYLDTVNFSIYFQNGTVDFNNYTESISGGYLYSTYLINLSAKTRILEVCARDRLTFSPYKDNYKTAISNSFIQFKDADTLNDITAVFEIYNSNKEKSDLKEKKIVLYANQDGKHIKYGGIADFSKGDIGRFVYHSNNPKVSLIPKFDRVGHFITSDYALYFHHQDLIEKGFEVFDYGLDKNGDYYVDFSVIKAGVSDFDPISGGLNNYCENRTITYGLNTTSSFSSGSSGLKVVYQRETIYQGNVCSNISFRPVIHDLSLLGYWVEAVISCADYSIGQVFT